jgi:hypothetical protein
LSRRSQTILALVLNAVAAILLLFAFQSASTTDLKVTPQGAILCMGQGEISYGPTGGLNCSDAKPLAFVKSDSPWMFQVGFALMLVSTVWQITLVALSRPEL